MGLGKNLITDRTDNTTPVLAKSETLIKHADKEVGNVPLAKPLSQEPKGSSGRKGSKSLGAGNHLFESPDILAAMKQSAEVAAKAEPPVVQIMMRVPREEVADLYYLIHRVTAASPIPPSRFGTARIIAEICRSLVSDKMPADFQEQIVRVAAEQIATAPYHRRKNKD